MGAEEQGTGIRRPLASDKAELPLEAVEQLGLDRGVVVGGIFEVHRIAKRLQQQELEAAQGQLWRLAVRQRHQGTGIGIKHLGKGGMGFEQVVDQLVEIETVEEAIATESQGVIRAFDLGEVLEIPLATPAHGEQGEGLQQPLQRGAWPARTASHQGKSAAILGEDLDQLTGLPIGPTVDDESRVQQSASAT